MIDLDFINDPVWRKQREAEWKKYKKQCLGSEWSKAEIEVERRYFMDLESTTHNGYSVGDGSKISVFPLRNKEAWEYFLRELASAKPVENSVTKYLAESAVLTMSFNWTLEENIALFDFVLGEHYSPKVKFDFPISKEKLEQEYVFEKGYVVNQVISTFNIWLRYSSSDDIEGCDSHYGVASLWINKIDYLFEAVACECPTVVTDMQNLLPKDDIYDIECTDRSVLLFLRLLAYADKYDDFKCKPELSRQCLDLVIQGLKKLEAYPGQVDEVIDLVPGYE